MAKSFYITTTLPYVNAPLHMGHALELIRADTIARYKYLVGFDVFFNTGTDEHGIKIFDKAKAEGMDVQDFVNKVLKLLKNNWKCLASPKMRILFVRLMCTTQSQLKNFGVKLPRMDIFTRKIKKRNIVSAVRVKRRIQN